MTGIFIWRLIARGGRTVFLDVACFALAIVLIDGLSALIFWDIGHMTVQRLSGLLHRHLADGFIGVGSVVAEFALADMAIRGGRSIWRRMLRFPDGDVRGELMVKWGICLSALCLIHSANSPVMLQEPWSGPLFIGTFSFFLALSLLGGKNFGRLLNRGDSATG